MDKKLIIALVDAANTLDDLKFYKEANQLTEMAKRFAQNNNKDINKLNDEEFQKFLENVAPPPDFKDIYNKNKDYKDYDDLFINNIENAKNDDGSPLINFKNNNPDGGEGGGSASNSLEEDLYEYDDEGPDLDDVRGKFIRPGEEIDFDDEEELPELEDEIYWNKPPMAKDVGFSNSLIYF